MPVSAILTAGNTARERIDSLHNAVICIPDTRDLPNQATSDFVDACATHISSLIIYHLTVLDEAQQTFIGRLMVNRFQATRAAIVAPELILFTGTTLSRVFVATIPFRDALRGQGVAIPDHARFYEVNADNNPVHPEQLIPRLIVPPPGQLPKEEESYESSRDKQLTKFSLKDADRIEPVQGMYSNMLFIPHYGAKPTMARGLGNIAGILGAELSEDIPPMSLSMLEKVLLGNFHSRYGKLTSEHASLIVFAQNKKIATTEELMFTINTFEKFCTAIYGDEVAPAINVFVDFMAIHLNSKYMSNSTHSKLTLNQHITLFDQCVFRVAHDSTAINIVDDPEKRWMHGFESVLCNTKHIATLQDVTTEGRINSQEADIAQLKSELGKRGKQGLASTKTDPPLKQKKYDPSAIECGFYKKGNCKRGKKCDHLHNGKAASTQPAVPS